MTSVYGIKANKMPFFKKNLPQKFNHAPLMSTSQLILNIVLEISITMSVVRYQMPFCNISRQYFGFYSWNDCSSATSCQSTTDLWSHMTLFYTLSVLLVECCCYLKNFTFFLLLRMLVSYIYLVSKLLLGTFQEYQFHQILVGDMLLLV